MIHLEKLRPLDFYTKTANVFAETPCGKHIVSMVEFEGKLIVATAERVYLLSKEGVFTPVLFDHANN